MNEFFSADMNLDQLISTWIIIMLSSAALCFLVSEIAGNYSQVDKLWSLLPLIYSLVTLSSCPSPRLGLMSLLVITWGLRLSYNFYRKGGYNIIPWKGDEDYRWKILRQNPALKGRLRFGLFNLLFISVYQNFLILLFSTPLLMAAKYKDSPLTDLDTLAAALMILFIFIETIADNQQFRFHKMKRQSSGSNGLYAKSLKKGFLSEGLWKYVRHPNFVSEQAIWISFYLFGVSASGQWFNWTISGSFLLVLLFIGSSGMTESISSSKYPGYADYKKEVPRFIPRIFRAGKRSEG
jgi:steroid 5-alpha reductase family enzyme